MVSRARNTAASGTNPGWDIAVPSRGRPGRPAGIRMAGFQDRANVPVDLRVVPHPAVTIVFDLGDSPFAVEDGGGVRQAGSVVAGLAPTRVRARARGFECLQIRLSPVVAHAVLAGSSELGGTVVPLERLWGRDAARTEERLRAAGSWDDRFEIVAAAFARRVTAARAPDPEVAFAWAQMLARRGQVRVEHLSAELGWSRKRLWSRFRSQIGETPKRAAQLVRFDDAAHRLVAGRSPALAAAESGFADQSHLHRDILSFAGVTPAAVAVEPWLVVDDTAWPAPSRCTPS